MSAYIIALLTFTDLPAYREYQAAFAEVFARFDAQLLVADEAPVLLEGGYSPEKIVVIEFAQPRRSAAICRTMLITNVFQKDRAERRCHPVRACEWYCRTSSSCMTPIGTGIRYDRYR